MGRGSPRGKKVPLSLSATGRRMPVAEPVQTAAGKFAIKWPRLYHRERPNTALEGYRPVPPKHRIP